MVGLGFCPVPLALTFLAACLVPKGAEAAQSCLPFGPLFSEILLPHPPNSSLPGIALAGWVCLALLCRGKRRRGEERQPGRGGRGAGLIRAGGSEVLSADWKASREGAESKKEGEAAAGAGQNPFHPLHFYVLFSSFPILQGL